MLSSEAFIDIVVLPCSELCWMKIFQNGSHHKTTCSLCIQHVTKSKARGRLMKAKECVCGNAAKGTTLHATVTTTAAVTTPATRKVKQILTPQQRTQNSTGTDIECDKALLPPLR